METQTRTPSLAERAAYLRRAQSRKRTANVKRSPNGPLLPSMDRAREALEVAWESTQDARPEQEPNVSPATVPWKPSQGRGATSDVKLYKVHYRLHRGKWRVRNDYWSRERSPEVGAAKVAALVAERNWLYIPQAIGTGGYAPIWTAKGTRPEWRDRNYLDLGPLTDRADDASLWAERWGTIDGQAYRFRFNRETGEMRRP